MIRAGDEFLQTQNGNNNPYNQDNETSWLDWDLAVTNADILRFVKRMIAFRKARGALAPGLFWRGDVTCRGVGADPDLSWDSHTIAFYLRPAAYLPASSEIYAMVNAYWKDLTFGIVAPSSTQWRRALDTSLASPDDIVDPGAEPPVGADSYAVRARSVVVLVRGALR